MLTARIVFGCCRRIQAGTLNAHLVSLCGGLHREVMSVLRVCAATGGSEGGVVPCSFRAL